MNPLELKRMIDQMNAEQYAFGSVAAQDVNQGAPVFLQGMENAAGFNAAPSQMAPAIPQQMTQPAQPMAQPGMGAPQMPQ